MPKEEKMVAINPFSARVRLPDQLGYATRRLRAEDEFFVPHDLSRVLKAAKRADFSRPIGKVAPPPEVVIEKAAEATPAKVEEPELKPRAVGAVSTRTAPARRRTKKRAAKKA